jgi:transposase
VGLVGALLPGRTPVVVASGWTTGRWLTPVMGRTRTGSSWRDLPVVYDLWKAVYNRHRRWSADGTWIKVRWVAGRGGPGCLGGWAER